MNQSSLTEEQKAFPEAAPITKANRAKDAVIPVWFSWPRAGKVREIIAAESISNPID